MKYEELISMVKEVSGLGVAGFEYSEGDMRISLNFHAPYETVSNGTVSYGMVSGTQPVPCSFPQEPAATSQIQTESQPAVGELVKSPLVGTFYTSPAEDADPYVKAGDHVKKGQTLAIVEAMKLMNEIESEYDGIVDTILVKNKEAVGYGQPLFKIIPD